MPDKKEEGHAFEQETLAVTDCAGELFSVGIRLFFAFSIAVGAPAPFGAHCLSAAPGTRVVAACPLRSCMCWEAAPACLIATLRTRIKSSSPLRSCMCWTRRHGGP